MQSLAKRHTLKGVTGFDSLTFRHTWSCSPTGRGEGFKTAYSTSSNLVRTTILSLTYVLNLSIVVLVLN